MNNERSLYILGTRGVPAAHGGFETFAQRFALHMRDQGWRVTVYCQVDEGPADRSSTSGKASVASRWRPFRRRRDDEVRLGLRAPRDEGARRDAGARLQHRGLQRLPAADGQPRPDQYGRHRMEARQVALARPTVAVSERVGRRPDLDEADRRPSGDRPASGPASSQARHRHDPLRRRSRDGRARGAGAGPGPEPRTLSDLDRPDRAREQHPADDPGVSSRPRELQFVCLGKLDPDNNAYHARC
jgi:hypothetical protein